MCNCVRKRPEYLQKGFTLIELIVVFSIMAMLSVAAFASFVSFSNKQVVLDTVANMKTMLYTARSQSLSQSNKPTQCTPGNTCACPTGQQFSGYQVLFCCPVCTGGGCPLIPNVGCPMGCQARNSSGGNDNNEHYELQIMCSGNTYLVDSKDMPSTQIDVNSSSTTRSVLFQPLTGLVTGYGNIVVNGYGTTKTLTVSQTGVISSQ